MLSCLLFRLLLHEIRKVCSFPGSGAGQPGDRIVSHSLPRFPRGRAWHRKHTIKYGWVRGNRWGSVLRVNNNKGPRVWMPRGRGAARGSLQQLQTSEAAQGHNQWRSQRAGDDAILHGSRCCTTLRRSCCLRAHQSGGQRRNCRGKPGYVGAVGFSVLGQWASRCWCCV